MFAALSSPVAGLIAAAATIASATIPPPRSDPVDQMNVDVMSCHAAACGRKCEGVPKGSQGLVHHKTDLAIDGPELEGIAPREKMKDRVNQVFIQMIKGVRAKVGAHGCGHGRGGHVATEIESVY